jgi:glycine dehydrogenase subunit 1
MSYISLSDKDQKDMLAKIGVRSIDELFQCIPENIRLDRNLKVPNAHTELELINRFLLLSEKNTYNRYLSFLGAGAYQHFIPAAVDYLSIRGEFLSPYTPYQPEVSQGTLQSIFEFQTMICQLTGMDVANASLYDGASGAAEAVLMANRLTRKNKVLVAKSIHPQYRNVIETYTQNLDIHIEEIGYTDTGQVDLNGLKDLLDDQTSAVVIQSPNFFGTIEPFKEIAEQSRKNKTLSVFLVAEAVSMGILEAPGKLGADIVTGEAQSFGMPLSFGGPYLGFMACSKEFVRQFPGRIVGQTQDLDGNTGYVLTLSTREQHIRREKATSNICTNQALCALRATIFLELMGEEGFMDMARQNMQKAAYAFEQLSRLQGVKSRFSGKIFNEFVLGFERPWREVDLMLREKKICGGFPLEKDFPELKNCVLFNVTEMHTKEDIDRLTAALKEVLGTQQGGKQ